MNLENWGDEIYLMDEVHTPDSIPLFLCRWVLKKDKKP
jgi:phosphoribosylaminoimidazole-succinocarboxamide synthase